MTAYLSPDCVVGKCRACSGAAWNDEADLPTLCACGCHTPTDIYRVVWPITDEDQTLAELAATARGDLPDLLFEAGLQQVSAPTFTLAWPAEGGTELVATMSVHPWADPVCSVRRRAVVA